MQGTPDPGKKWRLLVALTIAAVITAVPSAMFQLLSGLFHRAPFSVKDLIGPAVLFLMVFGFWYLTYVRQTRKMAEFERLARLGSRISRKP